MPDYLVRWDIDIEATSPRDAAKKALEVQRDPKSIATVFFVRKHASDSRKPDLRFRQVDLGKGG